MSFTDCRQGKGGDEHGSIWYLAAHSEGQQMRVLLLSTFSASFSWL